MRTEHGRRTDEDEDGARTPVLAATEIYVEVPDPDGAGREVDVRITGAEALRLCGQQEAAWIVWYHEQVGQGATIRCVLLARAGDSSNRRSREAHDG